MDSKERQEALKELGFRAAVLTITDGESPHKALDELFKYEVYTDPWKFYGQPKDNLIPIVESDTVVIAASQTNEVLEFSLEAPDDIFFKCSEEQFILLLLIRSARMRIESGDSIKIIRSDIVDAITSFGISDLPDSIENLITEADKEIFSSMVFNLEDNFIRK